MLAVIGGSGFYALDGLEIKKRHEVDTPFGIPSDDIIEGIYNDQSLLFLARHGQGHRLLPHEVNYRANIFALKKLGASRILSVSASGSLQEELKPGDLSLVSQYFDHTRGKRDYSFFGNGVTAHISSAEPACPALSQDIEDAAKRINQELHTDKIYACVEGPRLGTRAESFFLKNAVKADLVGMTNIPEVFLAREAQLAYVTMCIVTDYDCWKEDAEEHVSLEMVFEIYGQSIEKAKAILLELLKEPLSDTPQEIKNALKSAVITSDENIEEHNLNWLNVLRA